MNRKNGSAKPLDLHVLIEKEGRLYSALCLELDVASQGRTLAQAKKILPKRFTSISKVFVTRVMSRSLSPRPAPVEEWLKYFQELPDKNDLPPKTLATMIR